MKYFLLSPEGRPVEATEQEYLWWRDQVCSFFGGVWMPASSIREIIWDPKEMVPPSFKKWTPQYDLARYFAFWHNSGGVLTIGIYNPIAHYGVPVRRCWVLIQIKEGKVEEKGAFESRLDLIQRSLKELGIGKHVGVEDVLRMNLYQEPPRVLVEDNGYPWITLEGVGNPYLK
jgi:hypothetical protein